MESKYERCQRGARIERQGRREGCNKGQIEKGGNEG